MELKRKPVSEEDWLEVVTLIDRYRSDDYVSEKEIPLLEFHLFTDSYAVDWLARVNTQDLVSIVQTFNLPSDSLALVQTEKAFPHKTPVHSYVVNILSLFDEFSFLSVESSEVGFLWVKAKTDFATSRVQFASKKKNLQLLTWLIDKSLMKGYGQEIYVTLDSILRLYYKD